MVIDGSLKIRPYDDSSGSTALEGSRAASATQRRGTMFVETAIGIALAVVVMIAVAQLVALVARQRREAAQSHLALQEVANVMERVFVLPWNNLTTEALAQMNALDESAVSLDDPQLSITVSELSDALPTKKIEIALSWRDLANRRVEPVRLVAWKQQPAAAE